MKIRLVDSDRPEAKKVPLRKVALRYGIVLIGVLPLVALVVFYLAAYAPVDQVQMVFDSLTRRDAPVGDLGAKALRWHPMLGVYVTELPDAILRGGRAALGHFATAFGLAALAMTAWAILLISPIVSRRDPAFDRIAGTRVVRS